MLINKMFGPIPFFFWLFSRVPRSIDLVAKSCSKLLDFVIVGSLEAFNRKSPVLIHIPWMSSFGDGGEEIYFGLLKARREGKKIVFLCPRRISSTFPIKVPNRELIRIESEYCYFRRDSPWRFLADWTFTILLSILRVLYLAWRINLKALQVIHTKRTVPSVKAQNVPHVRRGYPEFYIGRSTLWKPDRLDYFSWEVVRDYDWREQFSEPLAVGLSPKQQRQAEEIRVNMGIPLEDWFVCLHVREDRSYTEQHPGRANYMYASILNYVEAINVITAAGGWVVRLGDPRMSPLPPMERVIDYPFTPYKSESMDMYLFSECQFFLGMPSGPFDVSRLFQKRNLMANLTEWATAFPICKGDLGILKHVFSRPLDRFLSINEILEKPLFECQGGLYGLGDDYKMFENSPEEIRNVVEEFLNQPEEYQYSELQEEFNHRRRAQIHAGLAGYSLQTYPRLDIVDKYRYASRADSPEGTIGRKYLEQNWFSDSFGDTMPDHVTV